MKRKLEEDDLLSSRLKLVQSQDASVLQNSYKQLASASLFSTPPPLPVLDLLQKAYGSSEGDSISIADTKIATDTDSSLCFGEVLPSGVTKMMDEAHLNGKSAKVLIDLGMGLGKLAMQVFLQFNNLEKVIGVELAPSRSEKAQNALLQLSKLKPLYGSSWSSKIRDDGTHQLLETVILEEPASPLSCEERDDLKKFDIKNKGSRKIIAERVLEFRKANLFDAIECKDADIIICETKIRKTKWTLLCQLLDSAKKGARILTYEDLEEVYTAAKLPFAWRRLSVNTPRDYLAVTWCNDGHRFHLFQKI